MKFGPILLLLLALVGMEVYLAFWGKREGRMRAKQSLLMIGVIVAALLLWGGISYLLALVGLDSRIFTLLAAVACLLLAAPVYNRLNRILTGMTPEEQCKDALTRYAEKGDYNAAVQQGHRLVRMQPSGENYYLLGRCYELLKDYKNAVKYYQSSVDIDPELFMPFNNMGTSYLNLGEFALAREALEKARELQPDSPFVHANLAYTYACFGEIAEARTALEKAKESGYVDQGNHILHKINEEEEKRKEKEALADKPGEKLNEKDA